MRRGGVDGMDDSQVFWWIGSPIFVVGQKNCRQVRSGVGLWEIWFWQMGREELGLGLGLDWGPFLEFLLILVVCG